MANDGISPRKAMAGAGSGGDFGVDGVFRSGAGQHPDASMTHTPLGDGDRAVGAPIDHARDMHPAQAAPKHGPTHPGGYGKS